MCVCVCVCVCVHTHIHTCVCVCVCVHTHTHIQELEELRIAEEAVERKRQMGEARKRAQEQEERAREQERLDNSHQYHAAWSRSLKPKPYLNPMPKPSSLPTGKTPRSSNILPGAGLCTLTRGKKKKKVLFGVCWQRFGLVCV